MNKLCDVLIRNISGYLDVKDILNFELSAKRRGATLLCIFASVLLYTLTFLFLLMGLKHIL